MINSREFIFSAIFMEIFYRIDAEIYRSEIHTFSDNPPNDYAFGGDSYDPQENKWESGVHRISKNQYEKRNQLDTQDINADAKLYFVEKNGMYFACFADKDTARKLFKRHFKTRFK